MTMRAVQWSHRRRLPTINGSHQAPMRLSSASELAREAAGARSSGAGRQRFGSFLAPNEYG